MSDRSEKIRGFLTYAREDAPLRPVEERVGDYREVETNLPPEKTKQQAARCMNCGVPFCNDGCPLGNIIPDWNELVFHDRWDRALERLHSTNNFPEFTGLVCPAPCETACVLGINDDPVAIKRIEWEIIRHGLEAGPMAPVASRKKTGRRVAIVGSGPAGLAAAQQLARAGHDVVVFERQAKLGGLLRYGIPDFKLEKWLIDRRVEQLRAEGVEFRTRVHVGRDLPARTLRQQFDAVLLACGSEQPRDLPIEGRELGGIHFAMDFLRQQNKRNSGEPFDEIPISAEGKRVVVIGGGDTGSDCIGTSHRHGAAEVINLELMERPPDARAPETPWPRWPRLFRSSSSHLEGGRREFAAMSTRFSGHNGQVERLHAVRVKLESDRRSPAPVPIAGSEFEIECDLVLLAMGYVHVVHDALIRELGVKLDARGNVAAEPRGFVTTVPGVFAAGDARRGQSLVVWAIWEGREAARYIDEWLVGRPVLPSRDTYY